MSLLYLRFHEPLILLFLNLCDFSQRFFFVYCICSEEIRAGTPSRHCCRKYISQNRVGYVLHECAVYFLRKIEFVGVECWRALKHQNTQKSFSIVATDGTPHNPSERV